MVKRLKGIITILDFGFSNWIVRRNASEIRGLLSSILHLRFFIAEGAPHALWRERRLANADPGGAVYSVGDVRRHRIERGLAAAFGAIRTDAILVLHQMEFDFLWQIGKPRHTIIQDRTVD